jgi:outer membrane protein TolC
LIYLLVISTRAHSQEQTITLDQAYDMARANYPVIKQKDLLRQTAQLNIENLQKNFLPQVNLAGQASYQSAVTKIPLTLPGFSFESPSKDQYKITADVSQLLYDGGMTREQEQVQRLNAAVDDQRIEVELYRVKERINQLYLGILYLDEQVKQVELVKVDLQSGINRVEAQVNNGVAFRSNLNLLKAELLKNEQRLIEIISSRKGLTEAMSLLTGRNLPEQVKLEMPGNKIPGKEVNRPEIKLFSDQDKLITQQEKIIHAKNLPRASLFLQTGYGRPALNVLKNEFDAWYIGGLRLNWSLAGLYTKKREKQILDINKQILASQKESFLLNTNVQLQQQQSEIDKLMQLISTDKEIINLRASVKEAAKAQLDNGVITANDYLREVNAEDQARQLLITHQLQLLQAQINYNTISGNQ